MVILRPAFGGGAIEAMMLSRCQRTADGQEPNGRKEIGGPEWCCSGSILEGCRQTWALAISHIEPDSTCAEPQTAFSDGVHVLRIQRNVSHGYSLRQKIKLGSTCNFELR